MEKKSDSRIHIVFALPSFLFGGGIEMHLLKMLAHLDRNRFRYSLLTLFEYPDRPHMYDRLPADVSVERLVFRGWWDVPAWIALYTLLKRMRPGIVVSSMFSASTPLRLLKPLLGYRLIAREHNRYDDKRLYHRVFDHLLSYVTNAFVAVSTSVADFASCQACIPRKKFTVIHNGVDSEVIKKYCEEEAVAEISRIRAELQLSSDQHLVLNVARLKPQKNHELLIRAWALFSIVHPEYVLAIAGDGSDRPKIESLIAELGLEDSVRLLGRRNDIFAWYVASEFFVLTSIHEGFPNVGLESMAFGLPFVSTLVPGVDEFVEEGRNGMIVASEPAAVAAGMTTMAARNEHDRAVQQKACLLTAERFDIKKVVKKYENLFEEVYSKKF